MLSLGQIEMELLAALNQLHSSHGGPLRSLEGHLATGMPEVMDAAATKIPPLCLIVATQRKPGPLRPNNRCDWSNSFSLLVGARPGGTGPQVDDLLIKTNKILSGLVLLDGQTSELAPGPERLINTRPHLILFSQEWSFYNYQ